MNARETILDVLRRCTGSTVDDRTAAELAGDHRDRLDDAYRACTRALAEAATRKKHLEGQAEVAPPARRAALEQQADRLDERLDELRERRARIADLRENATSRVLMARADGDLSRIDDANALLDDAIDRLDGD